MAVNKKSYVVQLTEDQINCIRKDVLKSTPLEDLLHELFEKALHDKDDDLFHIIGKCIQFIKEREKKQKEQNVSDDGYIDY